MKDRLPSSYGAVYVPPHHRLRSFITTTPLSASSPPRAADSKPALSANKQQSAVVSSRNACLPHHFRKKSSLDELSSEGSDRDIELPSVHSVSVFYRGLCMVLIYTDMFICTSVIAICYSTAFQFVDFDIEFNESLNDFFCNRGNYFLGGACSWV